jgi:hypothetical protein
VSDGVTRSSFLALACLPLASPAVRGEGQAQPPGPTREDPAAHEDGRRTLRRFPANLLRGTVGVFHGSRSPAAGC